MKVTEGTETADPTPNLEQIELTLVASMKLMKRGRREIGRLRRKSRKLVSIAPNGGAPRGRTEGRPLP